MKKEEIDSSVLHFGKIEEIAQQKYLDYAMSVITSRALPDVRDGLKPVQRRILYAMHVLGVTSGGAYKKSARIVGDTIGKYHPHGDSSVYEAMVRTAQPFSMRMLLIDGQGNFGSVDGDSAAAMRYTEARFHKFSESMFKDINLNTVDMQPNYDGSEHEPTVLPLQFPNLLINGVQGIAVGMASNIPPHNPVEVMNAVKYLVQCRQDSIDASIDDLINLIPAPDFPTKGLVHGTHTMRDAWTTGRAKLKLRARWAEEVVDGRPVIAVTELPYQVNKEKLKKKITELALPISEKDHPNFGKPEVEGIYEVVDESDKTGMRLAIYLKHGYEPDIVFNRLIQLTELETSINYNCTVIVKGEPKLLGMRDILEEFIEHRNEVIIRRTQTLYDRNLARERILEGLMKAVHPDNIDKVIAIVRGSKEVKDAREKLIELLDVDETQCNAILELSLKRLTGLEIDAMKAELEVRIAENIRYRQILDDQQTRYEIIQQESDEQIESFMKTKEEIDRYWTTLPYSKRLTKINAELLETNLGSLVKEEDCVILYTNEGYIRRCPVEDFKEQNRGTQGNRKFDLHKNDYIVNTIDSFSHNSLMFITEKGQAFTINAYEVGTNLNGVHINNLLPHKKQEDKIAKILSVDFDVVGDLTLITRNGLVKRGNIQDYIKSSVYKAGIRIMRIADDDSIFEAHITTPDNDLMFFKADNTVSRTDIENFSIKKGRVTSGVAGTKLTDKLIGVISVGKNDENGIVATVTETGLIKLSYVSEYRQTSRKSKGVKAFKANDRSGSLVKASYVDNINSDIVTVTKKGLVNRINLSSFRVSSRISTGFKLIDLGKNDEIVSVFIIKSDGEGEVKVDAVEIIDPENEDQNQEVETEEEATEE
jgi:DNA gyrase subunit A